MKDLGKRIFEELIKDESMSELFFDKNGNPVFKGDNVLSRGIPATIEWCRYGYPKKFGFVDNFLPLAMVTYSDEVISKYRPKYNGEEVSTDCLEKV